MLVPQHRTYQQNTRDDHRHVRKQAELYKLRKVLAVKRKGAAIQRSHTFALRTQRTPKRKRGLRPLTRIFRECRHHDASHPLWDLVLALTKMLRVLLSMRAHHGRSIAG